MRARLKGITSPDAPFDRWSPDNEADFGILIEAQIGPDHTDQRETFGFLVCTPGWLDQRLGRDGQMFGRHLLIVGRWDRVAIEVKIRRLCDRVVAETWPALTNELGQFGHYAGERRAPRA